VKKNIIVTGGCGFIGSALIRNLIKNTEHNVLNMDKLTYAANPASLAEIEDSSRYTFLKKDIIDPDLAGIFKNFNPDIIMNLAAESHVDNSIVKPKEFIETNIIGTYNLLQLSVAFSKEKKSFLFHHISTDEVFGDLPHPDEIKDESELTLFSENSSYKPSSPYSASKASSDHLVRAWQRTYGLNTIITNCSNNYGPHQHSEKLIPLIITNAIKGNDLPVYGDGSQIRDWLFVEDHATALINVVMNGDIGETFNIGGNNEKRNIEVVNEICFQLDNILPKGVPHSNQIKYVNDRPGHDRRYAIDNKKIRSILNWSPKETFETGILKTIKWYINNQLGE